MIGVPPCSLDHSGTVGATLTINVGVIASLSGQQSRRHWRERAGSDWGI